MKSHSQPLTHALPEICPLCKRRQTIKKGKRTNKLATIQLWYCKNCEQVFSPQLTKHKTYPLKIILEALTTYNLGFTLEQVCHKIKQRYGYTLQPSTLSNWLREHEELCSYLRLREQASKLYPPHKTISSVKLYHRQVYIYRVHQAKLDLILAANEHARFAPLQAYLQDMLINCPHDLFEISQRASDNKAKFNLAQVSIKSKRNRANELAALALQTVTSNRERHDAVQQFILANDSVTVATEIPIVLTQDDIRHMKEALGFHIPLNIDPILTGHIDALQIRNGSIHILDYKPNAHKERPIEQLMSYALALARLTGLRLYDFTCAWFDEKNYYEFFPLHVVHKLPSRRH